MKGLKKSLTKEYLYLDFSHQTEGCILPLHTSVTLFLLSYCDCRIFEVCLVLTKEGTDSSLRDVLSQDIEIQFISRQELPPIVQSCCLPAVMEQPDNFCRAGLAVVLRHIIQKSYETDPSKKEILELLGFKKTCLKACAEVSQWTRLCELTIPLAIENFLRASSEQPAAIPVEILQLEKKLSEPVRVHNDDKLRRQKLKQQKAASVEPAQGAKGHAKSQVRPQEASEEPDPTSQSLELKVAFSKLTVQEGPAVTSKEPSHIRRARASDLPPLEHVFAEGLFFTLADIVLLPCIHHFLVIICKKFSERLTEFPLLASWYQRIQEVPRVKTAASKCGIQFLHLPELLTTPNKPDPQLSEALSGEEQNDPSFIGGPRPTMTKLMEKGIKVMFSPHPCPTWTLDWNSLPAAVSPKEGRMTGDRALRKQQQLNNLVYVVMNQAKRGDRIVDFCSGGGHLGIVLAHVLPSCQVALHACGVATDMVIEHCIKTRASFVTCPCCYGFIQNTSKFNFPKSEQFKKTLSYKEHMILCRFADQTAVQLPPQRRLIGACSHGAAAAGPGTLPRWVGKQCMCLVDLDRARAAEEHGYTVQVISMEPESCSPKNNMIVGVPV
nr:glutathione S-transferase C-terminal domain-containing protein isoform X3 [Cavia porcellus]